MVRLAAFDMDGTLLLPNHQLGQQTLESLQALHLRGVNLALATGRHLQEMQILREKMTLPAWLITGNGTRVHDRSGNLSSHVICLQPSLKRSSTATGIPPRQSIFSTIRGGLPIDLLRSCWWPIR
jgi:HAD superfamily hydrolase (TIGR01484 family)